MSVSLGFPLVVQENPKYNINLFDLQESGGFDLAKSAVGKDLHHDEMKLLEELELYLLCHVTSNDFNQMLKETHSEVHDFCGNAGIKTKIPF